MDHIGYGLGHAACHSKVSSVCGSVIYALWILFDILNIHMLCIKDSIHFFKGQDKIHLAADRFSHRFQLLCRAGADKYDLGIRVLSLDQSGGQNHRGQCHGNAVRVLREQLLCHHRPGRTAGSCHKRKLFWYLLQKVNGLLGRTQIRSDRYLKYIRKAQGLHRRTNLSRCYLRTELAYKGRSNGSIHLFSGLDGADDLKDLGLICNGSKGAVYKALSA